MTVTNKNYIHKLTTD